ncbi:MAG: hypothetical protein IT349_20125 [Candidatus Eisenbacteria bacterium]|nr:hypothetical protein [Candidatus Eisenbacteria bacterium]
MQPAPGRPSPRAVRPTRARVARPGLRSKARAAFLLTVLLSVTSRTYGADPADWSWHTRFGAEVDASGQRLGPGCLSDLTIEPDGSIDDLVEDLSLREEETRTSALLELRAERERDLWLRGFAQAKWSPARSRARIELGAGRSDAHQSWSWREEAEGTDGDAVALADLRHQSSLSYRRADLPFGLGLRGTVRDEQSWPRGDSLESYFRYRVFRPELTLDRALGLAGEVSLRLGTSRKWGDRPSSSYRGRRIEAALSSFTGDHGREVELGVAWDARQVVRADSLAPSYEEVTATATWRQPLAASLRLIVQPELSRRQYSADSSIFADHAGQGVSAGIEYAASGTDPAALDERSWEIGAHLRYERTGYETARDRDGEGWSVIQEAATGRVGSLWIDQRVELGFRAYRSGAECSEVTLDGLDLSSSRSDFRFLRASLLGEVGLPLRGRGALFLQYERELHDRSADDVTLWILSTSLTRTF